MPVSLRMVCHGLSDMLLDKKKARLKQEREHTLQELVKMEKVRSHLLANNIVDRDSFDDFLSELV